MLPSSEVLEKVNTVEFITTLSEFTVVDESVRVIRSVVPIGVNFHLKKRFVVVHVTPRLSLTRHIAALGDGDMITTPA